jgi:hypothetical protein
VITTSRTLLTGGAVAAGFLAGHGVLGLLAVIAYLWATGLIATGTAAKGRGTEHRLAAAIGLIGAAQSTASSAMDFVNNGGTVGGSVTVAGSQTVTGNHTVDGTAVLGAVQVNGTAWTQCGPQSTGTDGYGGGVWTAAQQTALLNLQAVANSSITSLTNHGFMA